MVVVARGQLPERTVLNPVHEQLITASEVAAPSSRLAMPRTTLAAFLTLGIPLQACQQLR